MRPPAGPASLLALGARRGGVSMHPWLPMLALFAAPPAPATPAPDDGHHLRIQIDYRFDRDGYFDDPTIRANLEAAVAVWSSSLHDDFPAVPAGTPLLVVDPGTLEETRVVLEYDVDDLVLFVGTNPQLESMARAGPVTRWYRRLNTEMPLDAAERIRGDDFEPWAGFLSINPDGPIPLYVDASPDTDDDIPLNSHRRYDLMTLMLHELGHVLGIGTAPEFRAQSGLLPSSGLSTRSTSDGRFLVVWSAYSVFYGPNARRLNAGEPIRLSEDMGHLATRFIVGGQQDLMDQDLNIIRQRPTALDLSLLLDLGYDAELPEP